MWKSKGPANKAAMAQRQVNLLEEIAIPFCNYLVDKKFHEFEYSRLANWIKINRSDIIPYVSRHDVPEDDSGRKLEKVIDVQFACYSLSKAESFLIRCDDCKKVINPFDKVGKATYLLKNNWQSHLCKCVNSVESK